MRAAALCSLLVLPLCLSLLPPSPPQADATASGLLDEASQLEVVAAKAMRDEDHFTAKILYYEQHDQARLDNMVKLTAALSRMPEVAQVQVLLNNAEAEPPNLSLFEKSGGQTSKVKLLPMGSNRLTNRFLGGSKSVSTAAVLSIDDDKDPQSAVEDARAMWRSWKEHPDDIHGTDCRAISRTHYDIFSKDKVNAVLTSIAMMPAELEDLYFHSKYNELRDFVDQHMNCEDILMNFVLQDAGRGAHKISECKDTAQIQSHSTTAISHKPDHNQQRDKCVQHFYSKLQIDLRPAHPAPVPPTSAMLASQKAANGNDGDKDEN